MTFPEELFEKVFKDLLPSLRTAWHSRNKRPLPESIQFTLSKFEKIWIIDGSILEAPHRKLQSLESVEKGQLAGKIITVIDLIIRLPVEIWFEENPKASDTRAEEDILNLVTENTLLLLDRGFYHFNLWHKLIEKKVEFITRIKKGSAIQIEQVFTDSYGRARPEDTPRFWHKKDSVYHVTFN